MSITLTKNQWARVSDILGNLGLLTLGSVVFPAFAKEGNLPSIISGLAIVAAVWYSSIKAATKY